ncbi:tetratricopeptide repeat protein [Hyphomicrobium sp. xq]|uniref:Tetratricopeptide repeat protein n=1 Tax=Hyphomicrobium album TaxID=2665159 RepID=A0A6I3KMF5_9HYPH|nr:tetratricopeptide repeat protein [Hyphomicrobium album]MTD95558.1 tetratricopeptide repeat protein [Hyphomicrobium album]
MASASHSAARRLRRGGTIAALTASLMLGACGQSMQPGTAGELISVTNGQQTPRRAPQTQTAGPANSETQGGVGSDLLRATDYWGQAYAKSPRELVPALNYARNLKAMGEKRRALAVLQQAALYHGQSRELAGEYGRLALDLDQVAAAKQLLAIADDPGRPDWRVVSARGAVLAKEGNYDEAIPFFEKALALSPDQPSVLSNLALAQAMNGQPAKAESLLRRAAATDGNSPRIRQNLALVLGLQGKYDEAKLVAVRDMPMTNAAENAEILQQLTMLDPKSVPNSDPVPADWIAEAKVAKAPVAEEQVFAAVPVEKVAETQNMAPLDPQAAGDTAWVVSTDAPASPPTEPVAKVMSVADLAKQFAVHEDGANEVVPEPKNGAKPAKQSAQKSGAGQQAWSPVVAQAKP